MMTYGSPSWRDWVLPESEGRRFFRRALEHGINFFDTADMYSLGMSEEILGRAIKDMAQRDQVVVATKAHFPMGDGPNDRGLSRKHLFDAIDGSLRRLGLDHVDLYQIHRLDPETPIEETLGALNDIVRAGKVRYLGASSMYAWQFAQLLHTADRHGWARFVTMQNHYNLVYREEEREMLPLCRAEGVGIIPWSPLARGFLAGTRKPESEAWGTTDRAKSDGFAHQLYYAAYMLPCYALVAVGSRDAWRTRNSLWFISLWVSVASVLLRMLTHVDSPLRYAYTPQVFLFFCAVWSWVGWREQHGALWKVDHAAHQFAERPLS